MSLLWPERVLMSLAPAGVHAVRISGAFREKIAAPRHASADGADGRAPWQGATEALQVALEAWNDLRGDVTVLLSNAFVRYAAVPHAGQLSRSDERLSVARARFASIHGERARDWEVRIARCRRGEPGLAIAVDRPLVEALKACFSGKRRLRLASVQPYLMAAFNRWRPLVPASGAWVVLTEPDRTCIALLDGGRWLGVAVTRERPPAGLEDCVPLVERERARLAARGPRLVLATFDGAGEKELGEWQLKALPIREDPSAMVMNAR